MNSDLIARIVSLILALITAEIESASPVRPDRVLEIAKDYKGFLA